MLLSACHTKPNYVAEVNNVYYYSSTHNGKSVDINIIYAGTNKRGEYVFVEDGLTNDNGLLFSCSSPCKEVRNIAITNGKKTVDTTIIPTEGSLIWLITQDIIAGNLKARPG